jgi:ABC-type branched-subunit amino acid transport system substrate-binding protein
MGVVLFGVVVLLGATLLPVAGGAGAEVTGSTKWVPPCGKGNATGATDVGVTDKTITISTIQDIAGPRPGLFKSNQEAMRAFVAYCNSLGGINGRKLDLIEYDSALLDSYPQFVKACDSSFAIVGENLIFDDAGVKPTEECGIPSVTAQSRTARQASDLVFSAVPSADGRISVARARWLTKKFPGVQKAAAMLYPSTSTTKNSAEKQIAGMEQVGFEFVYEGVTEINVVNWGPFVDQIRQNNVKYLTMVADFVNWSGLLREMVAQGVKVEVADATSASYTTDFIDLAGPAAEGALVALSTAPFEEAKKVPELANYMKWIKKEGGKPTTFGVNGWSAGLLFATAAKSLGSDLTREGLVTALQGIHSWDGNGIQATVDPGAKITSVCYAVMQVKNGKFVRYYPKKGFACGTAKDIVDVPKELA